MTKDPLEIIIEQEDTVELVRRSEIQADRIQAIFFPGNELDVWMERHRNNVPVRNLAITFHMSRYNIRKTIRIVDKKIKALRILFSL